MIKKTQIYKIYINEVELILTAPSNLDKFNDGSPTTLVGNYTGKIKQLLNYIDLCEKGSKYSKVIICHADFLKMYEQFKSLYLILKAAGGLIKNESDEFLFIFRRGYWDLPKGKIEFDETKKQAAIREVEEETGIKNVILEKKICKTYHTYRLKQGKRIIKKSYWYLMTAPKQTLIPQEAEDIEKAEWMTIAAFKENCHPVYKNILEVIEKYENSQQ